MNKTLEQAIAKLSNLPLADQEHIGRTLLSHVDRLRELRVEIDKRINSLNRDQGRKLDIEDLIAARMRTSLSAGSFDCRSWRLRFKSLRCGAVVSLGAISKPIRPAP